MLPATMPPAAKWQAGHASDQCSLTVVWRQTNPKKSEKIHVRGVEHVVDGSRDVWSGESLISYSFTLRDEGRPQGLNRQAPAKIDEVATRTPRRSPTNPVDPATDLDHFTP